MKTKLVILLIALGTTLSVVAQPEKFSFNQNYNVKEPVTLRMNVVDSDIKTMGHEGNQIELYFIVKKNKEVQQISFEELKEYFTIKITELENGIDLSAKPTLKNTKLHWEKRYNLSFYVLTPNTTSCNLVSVDGDLHLKTLKGVQELKTVDGDIYYTEIIGNVNARTVDGDVKAKTLKGNSELKTVDGDVEVNGIIGNFYAKTTDGDISVQLVKGEIQTASVDGSVYLQMAALEKPITVSTVDGDVKILLNKGTGFNVSMKGDDLNGNFKDFDGTISDNSIEGRVNGGGEIIKISSVDGDITIKFLDKN